MLQWIYTKIKVFDMFGQPVRLKINGEDSVRSLFGSLMTICLVLLIAITFGLYSQICFYKINPHILVSTDFEDVSNDIYLNQTYFRFRIGSNGKQIDLSPYFSIGIGQFKFSDCREDKKYPNIKTEPKYEGKILTNNWYCVDFKKSDIMLENFDFILYYSTENKYCKSRTEIDSFIGAGLGEFVYSFESNIMQPHDYKDPLPINKRDQILYLYPNTKIKAFLGFTPYKLFTDDGFIYSHNYSNTNSSKSQLQMISKEFHLFLVIATEINPTKPYTSFIATYFYQ